MRIKKSMLSDLKNTKSGLCKKFLLPAFPLSWGTDITHLLYFLHWQRSSCLMIFCSSNWFQSLKRLAWGLTGHLYLLPHFLLVTTNPRFSIWPWMQILSSSEENHRGSYYQFSTSPKRIGLNRHYPQEERWLSFPLPLEETVYDAAMKTDHYRL